MLLRSVCLLALSCLTLTALAACSGDSAGLDDARIVFASDRDGQPDIYVMASDGGAVRRLTDNIAFDGNPDWSPDGARIAFTSDRDGDLEIYVMDSDGSNVAALTRHGHRSSSTSMARCAARSRICPSRSTVRSS